MSVSRRSTIILLAAALAIAQGCEKGGVFGDPAENLPPTTRLTVDAIDLPDGTLLSSRIPLSWWGNDPDGYIIGYEYAINDTSETAWRFTARADSIFTLPIAAGQAADTVLFKVRAVDNAGAKDPAGARIMLPVRNTAPSVSFNPAQAPPAETFSVVSMGWTVADQDGLVSLDRVEIAFNDTMDPSGWTALAIPGADEVVAVGGSGNASGENTGDGATDAGTTEGRMFITLVLDDGANGTDGPVEASGLIGTSLSTPATPIRFRNLLPGERNTAYLRVIDNSGAVSQVDQLSWTIRPRTSRVLFLNDDDTPQSQAKEAAHLAWLSAAGIRPDILRIQDGTATGGAKVRLSAAFPGNQATQARMLAEWDHIYWMSNDLDRNITYAQQMTSRFLEQGGTLFAAIPSKNLSIADELFRFLPVGAIAAPEGIQNSFRILRNADVTPAEGLGLPTLRLSSTVLNVNPMQAVAGATALYTADFKAQWITGQVVDYAGFEDVVIRSGEGNLIYAALDLTVANANANMAEFVEALCVDMLGFAP